MNWKVRLTTRAESAYGSLLRLLDMCSESDMAFKPAPENNWFAQAQLLHHLGNACGLMARGFATGEWDFSESIDPDWKPEPDEPMGMPPAEAHLRVVDLAQARQRIEADRERFFATLDALSEEQLATQRSTAPWGGEETCLGNHLLSCIMHLESHKAQLFYYLKLQGKPVGTQLCMGCRWRQS